MYIHKDLAIFNFCVIYLFTSTKSTTEYYKYYKHMMNDRFIGYLEAIAEELVVEELVDDQYLAEDDEEVGGLAGVE